MEEWKDIKGYIGIYQISNLGNVKSIDRVVLRNNKYPIELKGKILYQGERNNYKVVQLSKDNKRKGLQVHRLVAEAFIPNLDNKSCVNHKDGNKHNNCVDNLEWATYQENHIHALNTGLKSRINSSNKRVKQYDLEMNFIKEYVSLCEAERQTNAKRPNIVKCCEGVYKSSGGYVWRYSNE